MQVTCGFFIINDEDEILLCHPTNAPHNVLSIPKGLIDVGESELEAACRETLEETGIDLLSLGLISKYGYIGRSIYKHGKKCLVGFYYNLNYDIKKCVCNSFVELTDSRFPEVDYFKSVPIKDAYKLLHHTQQELLNVHMNQQLACPDCEGIAMMKVKEYHHFYYKCNSCAYEFTTTESDAISMSELKFKMGR